jgi:integrase
MHSIGSDKTQAFAAARVLNDRLIQSTDITAAILSPGSISMEDLIKKYEKELLPTKDIGPRTLGHYERRLKRFKKDIPNWNVSETTIGEVASYLDENFKNDSYIKHRSMLSELFNFSQNKGYRTNNPVEPTLSKSAVKKQRQRLKLNEYKAIHEIAPDWMKIAMELGLLTLQGRHEVCNMKFSDVKDDYLYVIREKTKKNEWSHLRIKMNPALEDLKSRAKRSGLVSPYFVHREPGRRIKAQERDHWTQLTLNDFSARFRELRDKTGLFDHLDARQKPTFHEIRALGSWLYEKQGFGTGEYVQKLMAHADEKMTEYYQSGHETKWMEVEAGLDIKAVFS